MPKYQFQSGSDTYEIESDHDLSDQELANYAKTYSQAKPQEAAKPQVNQEPYTAPVEAFGSEGAGKVAGQYFPRTAKAAGQGKGYLPQAGASILDLLSLPGRAVAASGKAPEGASWKDGNPKLGETKGMIRDPGLAAALLTAPLTGGGSIPALMGSGALAGTASAAAHQGERVLEGKRVSPAGAAGEIALNTALPVAARFGGQAMKAGGKKILETILKPSVGVTDQLPKLGAKSVSELIFKNNLDSPVPFTGGVEGIAKRTGELRGATNKAFGEVMDANQNVNIDLLQALSSGSGKMAKEFADEGLHAGVLPGIKNGEEYWTGALARKSPNGVAPLKFSQGFKQEMGDAGNFIATDPGEVKGAARFATEGYRQIRDIQNQAVPELIPLNKTLSETMPIKQALEDAIPRLQKNNAISPTDLWALAPSVLGGGGALAAGTNPGVAAAAFAAPLAVNRLSKNPTVASQMYRLGESMVDPGVMAETRKKAIERALGSGLFGENQ